MFFGVMESFFGFVREKKFLFKRMVGSFFGLNFKFGRKVIWGLGCRDLFIRS